MNSPKLSPLMFNNPPDKLTRHVAHTTHFYGPNINFMYNGRKALGFRRLETVEVVHFLKG